MTPAAPPPDHTLRARRLGLITQDEPVVLVRADSYVGRAEGVAPRSQVLVTSRKGAVSSTLYHVTSDLLGPMEIGLSEAAWRRLCVEDGDELAVCHPPPLESLTGLRRRIFGERLSERGYAALVGDIVAGRYTDAHLAAFIAASAAFPLDLTETTHLTNAMVNSGQRISWSRPLVIDKHCVGGLPGNRTSPIVVAIAAAAGLIIPKTSSRAITSPAGTADVMEVLMKVDLDIPHVRKVVEAEGGCLVWGGRMELSPADEVLARMGRMLEMDVEGQLVASILSKKVAAGATHVVIDIPVGPTAKVRTPAAAASLIERLVAVGRALDLEVRCLVSDGLQPVGRGIGPALEARDVLAVLGREPDAPTDLRERALAVAGLVLELGRLASGGGGVQLARTILDDGRALKKFERIRRAQGGVRAPTDAPLRRDWPAPTSGALVHINNRKLARVAKLAGAPDVKAAGLVRHVSLGASVVAGEPLMTVHSAAEGELQYALDYARANPDIFGIET